MLYNQSRQKAVYYSVERKLSYYVFELSCLLFCSFKETQCDISCLSLVFFIQLSYDFLRYLWKYLSDIKRHGILLHSKKCLFLCLHVKDINFPFGVSYNPQRLFLHFSENFSQCIMQNSEGIGIFSSLINFAMEHRYAKCRFDLHKKHVGLFLNKPSALPFSLLPWFIIFWNIRNHRGIKHVFGFILIKHITPQYMV